MRRLGLIVLSSALGAACNCGGGDEVFKLVPHITAQPNPLDFGTVYVGLRTSRTLSIKNDGNAELQVTGLSIEAGSYGGLSVEDGQFVVPPLGSHDVMVSLEAHEIAPITGAVLIASSDPRTPSLRVPVTAQGARRPGPVIAVCVESLDLGLQRTCDLPLSIDFGTQTLSSSTRAKIVIRSIGDQPLNISSAQPTASSDPSFHFSPPAFAAAIAVDTEQEIEVTLQPAGEGALQAVYQIVSDDAEHDLIPVTLTANGVRSGLCADPSSIDFGTPQVGQPVTRPVTLTNCGQIDLDLTTLQIESGSPEFTVAALQSPVHLTPGASHAVDVTYTPANTGSDSARLHAIASAGEAFVSLVGQTAVCDVVVAPSSVSFGAVGIGQSRTRDVSIQNVGAAACSITNLVTGGSQEFAIQSPPSFPAPLASGASMTITLVYAPADAGADTGTFTVASDDPSEPVINIPLDGRRLELGECTLTATPDPIAFGVVGVGTRQSIGVQITNAGTNNCTVLEVKLDGSSSPFFSAVGQPTIPLVLPGRSFTTTVVFQPTAVGQFTGTLNIKTRLTSPPITFPITGTGAGARICVSPSPVVFGSHPQGSTITRQATVTSCGTEALVVSSVQLAPPTSAAFQIASPPSTPLTLPAGASATIDLRYSSAALGRDDGILRIASNDNVEPQKDVALVGATGQSCGDLTARICGLDGVGAVSGATVYVDTPNGRIQTTTDAHGDFILTCLPVGGVTVTAESGSWTTTFQAQIQDQTLTSVPGQQCLDSHTARVAVVWGQWDQMENILQFIRVPYTFYGENEQSNLLSDPSEMAQYDIIFLNCGFTDSLVTSGSGARYLTDWVANGGSLYASDWAYDAIEQNWPMFIDFDGDDSVTDSAQNAGQFDGLVDVVEPTLRAALNGRGSVPIESCCTAMDSVVSPTTTYLEGDRYKDGGRHPFFVSFKPTPTAGTVMYTDFHNNGQADIQTIFSWLINRL